MHETNIRGLDLNLLVVLEQLLEQPTVTEAAEELGMSQPAASRALSRLRLMFNDTLLAPSGRGLVLTPKAESLRAPVKKVLNEFRRLLAPRTFSPGDAEFEFRLCTLDYESLVFLPKFLGALSEAPGIRVEIPARVQDPLAELREGRLDLIVGALGGLSSDFRSELLFEDRFVCVAREDHPLLKSGLTLEVFLELPHIMITTTGAPGGPVDTILKEKGLERRVGLRLPHFLAAPLAAAQTDMLLTLPERLAREAADWVPLGIWEPPLDLNTVPFQMIWHERLHTDQAHQWIRGKALQAASLL